jgi:ribosomal protein S18 acetylase RimI-like enzyme
MAAFCVCWMHKESDSIEQVEPLGVHPDFCNSGLGRANMTEGLRRLHRNGASNVFVETDKYRNAALELYKRAGFHIIQDVHVYRKDYN